MNCVPDSTSAEAAYSPPPVFAMLLLKVVFATLAAQLKKDGLKAEAAGQKEEALKKYKESVVLIPDPELDNRIKKLETELAAIQAKKNKADELWNEGEKLASKKKTKKDGLGKMKESLE